MSHLEQYFSQFRDKIIGVDQFFDSPHGPKRIVYADWTASGRMYKDIEYKMINEILPYVANTHTETNVTGTTMTLAYKQARKIIKDHVNAGKDDVLISTSSGMTGVVNKFQRILGLKIHEKFRKSIDIPQNERPVVFCTHMEHHSNQTSWLETIAEVVVMPCCGKGLVDLEAFEEVLKQYKDRPLKIAAITSCSNVTGIITPYADVAKMIHKYNGLCFVDFACSAPYIDIDMHPADPECKLDAIYFSPHKFLGGPGSSGVLIFDAKLYKNEVPDNPGGGTVDWTNPWGKHKYYDEIEAREDGGTPAFLQTIRVALAINLKDEMGVENIINREHELLERLWPSLENVLGLHILADQHKDRLGVISFYIENLHYNLGVKLLNDRFGIQVRGGCSCAGTYGHYLLEVSQETSDRITEKISIGDLTNKPGWIRMSIHPTTTNEEIDYISSSIRSLAENHQEWAKDYKYLPSHNEFEYLGENHVENSIIKEWFTVNKREMAM